MRTLTIRVLIVVAIVVMVLAWVGCTKKVGIDGADNSDGAVDGSAVVIADNVVVIPDEQASTVRIEIDRLVFPAIAGNASLLDLQAGQIVVAGPAAQESGFLRRVQEVQSSLGNIVIIAEQAALTDAIVQGEFNELFDSNGARRYGTGAVEGLRVDQDFSGAMLLDRDGLQVQIAQGRILFDPNFEFGLDINSARLGELVAIVSGQLETNLALQITANAAVQESAAVKLWESPPLVLVQMLGPVPVVEVVTVTLHFGVELDLSGATTASGGIATTGNISAGVKYVQGNWMKVQENNLEFSAVGPTFENNRALTFRGYLEPRLNILFYKVAGPAIAVRPYVAVSVDGAIAPPPWKLFAGLTGSVQVGANILGLSVANYSAELFGFEQQIARGVLTEGEGESEAEAESETDQPCGDFLDAVLAIQMRGMYWKGVAHYFIQDTGGTCNWFEPPGMYYVSYDEVCYPLADPAPGIYRLGIRLWNNGEEIVEIFSRGVLVGSTSIVIENNTDCVYGSEPECIDSYYWYAGDITVAGGGVVSFQPVETCVGINPAPETEGVGNPPCPPNPCDL